MICKTSAGVAVRTFTDGVQANATEVISDSFTGTDYDDASTGVNKPITLGGVLNKWNDSAGTTGIDWKVDINGTGTNISTALGAVSGLFFNVKDPAYGATGDGSTDDTAAIQAAENAADDNGGMVFFPPGIYRITSTITINEKVSFVGVDPGSSVIKIDTASNWNTFSVSISVETAGLQKIQGLGFVCSQANTGSFISLGASTEVMISNCNFAASNLTGEVIDAFSAQPNHLTVNNCIFNINASGAQTIKSQAYSLNVKDNVFYLPDAFSADVIHLENGTVRGNVFYPTGTAGQDSHSCIYVDNDVGTDTGIASIIGNVFNPERIALTTGLVAIEYENLSQASTNGSNNSEVGNIVHDSASLYKAGLSPGDITTRDEYDIAWNSRCGRVDALEGQGGSSPVNLTQAKSAEIITIDLTTNGAVTWTCTNSIAPPGSRLILVFSNSSGAATGNQTLQDGFITTTAIQPFIINTDTNIRVLEFVSVPAELND
ncbi:MAG: glycosyl hydrolase family 28-related protein, partial [Candidatus Hodarchaeales archaeon]